MIRNIPPLFTDGQNRFELLSLEQSMEEFKVIEPDKVLLPILKESSGTFVYVDPFTDIFNASLLYTESVGKAVLLDYDFVDILLATASMPSSR